MVEQVSGARGQPGRG